MNQLNEHPIINREGIRKVCVSYGKPCVNCYSYGGPCGNCKYDDDIKEYTSISYKTIFLFGNYDTYEDFFYNKKGVQEYKWDKAYDKTLKYIDVDFVNIVTVVTVEILNNHPIINPKGFRKVCISYGKPCVNCYLYGGPCYNCRYDSIDGYVNIS